MNDFDLIEVTTETKAEQKVLASLTKMYCYEWSQYTGMTVDKNGDYSFEKYLPLYWQRKDRKAFLLHKKTGLGCEWAGFALIDKDFCLHPDFDYSLAEFFVMFNYRKHGVGRFMATALFDRFQGKWEVGRNPKNRTAYNFWQEVIEDYSGGDYKLVLCTEKHTYADGTLGDVFAFNSAKKH